jgi:hypothetical protein
MAGLPECVTFEPKGFRDVYWCPALNEPFVVEYDLILGSPNAGKTVCPYCGTLEFSEHTFIAHILKPRT